ncbi:hypothetical protein CUC08_Gglean000251 [Alternaria sp. MG1]|nr:hypothetical protein CUC08_Gglean000251 [Alternaria sp. MG1]
MAGFEAPKAEAESPLASYQHEQLQAFSAICITFTPILQDHKVSRNHRLAPAMASTFHGAIGAHVAIAAPHCGPGGTMNFNFGPGRADGQKQKPEPFSTVPFAPDPDLVDRPGIAAWVRDKCAGPGARAALVGLGGVGCRQRESMGAGRSEDNG